MQYLFLSILILFEIFADILAKEWTIRNKTIFSISALLIYLLANGAWLLSLKTGLGLGKGAVLFAVISGIVGLVIGIIFYKEPVNRVQLTGLLFGVVAIGLISYE